MPLRIAKVKSTTLELPLTGDATSIQLKEFVTHKDEQLDIDDFGGLVVLILKQGDQVELAICDSLSYDDDGVATLEFANNGRNLDGQYPYTGTNVGLAFSVGAEVVVGDDPYTVYQITEAYTNSVAYSGAPDASQTVKGIVEVATQAEIDADADAGATGAPLSVSPDQLVLSKYGLRLPSPGQNAFLDAITGMISMYGSATPRPRGRKTGTSATTTPRTPLLMSLGPTCTRSTRSRFPSLPSP